MPSHKIPYFLDSGATVSYSLTVKFSGRAHSQILPWPLTFWDISQEQRAFFLGLLLRLWGKSAWKPFYLPQALPECCPGGRTVLYAPFQPLHHATLVTDTTPVEEVMSPSSNSSAWHIQQWLWANPLLRVRLLSPFVSVRTVSFHWPTNTVAVSGLCWGCGPNLFFFFHPSKSFQPFKAQIESVFLFAFLSILILTISQTPLVVIVAIHARLIH